MTAILFDLDGPLVDSRAAITSCLNHALRQQGFPERTPEELYAHIGPALADAFAEIVGEPLDSETFSEPILEALGIRSRFDVVAGPDLNPFGETKATTIAAALEVVGRPAVMVGDRRHDVEGAHANGIPCIGVTWGIGTAAELDAAGADALARAPAELLGSVGQKAV
jgi:phosphoglycolate phosphatase